MILNNYNTIRKLKDLIGEKLTIDIILEIHSSITKNTLNSPGQEGQFRKSNDIVVVNSNGDIVRAENFDGILSKLIAEGQKAIIQQQAFH
jgi:hypothetical protein